MPGDIVGGGGGRWGGGVALASFQIRVRALMHLPRPCLPFVAHFLFLPPRRRRRRRQPRPACGI